MSKRHGFENYALAMFVVTVLMLVGACERAKWRECRRYHPVWYCFVTAGGGK